ncbi:AMP-binding protein [Streptomyces tendae]|uniref:AMP-binding protein n=1 Tax=Streptomyces tendae TaxID=1932 RepID=UPI0033C06901
MVFPEVLVELSHRDVAPRAHAFASELCSVGVSDGDVVGILIPTGPEFLPAFFALPVVGAVASALPLPPVLLDPVATARQLEPIVKAGRIRQLIVAGIGEAVAVELKAADRGLVIIDASKAHLPTSVQLPITGRAQCDPASPAIVQFSSGSTARPKGVLLSHGAALAGVTAVVEHLRFTSADVVVQRVPLFHDMGLIGLMITLATPCDAHVMRPSTFIRKPGHLLTYAVDVQASVVTGPNFSYDNLISAAAACHLGPSALSHWRIALNGAESDARRR